MTLKKRKRFIVLLLSIVAASYLIANTNAMLPEVSFASRNLSASPMPDKKFVPFQLALAPKFGGGVFNHNTPVYGMSIGGMVHQKEINGISVAGVHAFTKKKQGLSFSLMDICNESRGASFFVAGGAERNYGFSAGLINLAEHNTGFQLGIINQVQPDAVIENNYTVPESPDGIGVQTGIIN